MFRNIAFIVRAICVAVITLLHGCAVIRPPDGGPPDKKGPEILSVYPNNGAVKFVGESVTIEFDEYVNKSNFAQNLFISPNISTDLNWSGRKVEILFLDPLAPNTSYAVTLGTELTDLHNNKPDKAFTLIFSTGERVDSGIIRGKILSPNSEGVFLFLYPLKGIDPDTLNPAHTKPKYRTQSGASGSFEFAALSDGSYRLFAVKDEFKNGLLDEGIDGFGVPWEEINVRAGTPEIVNLLAGPPRDTTGPILYDARSISSRTLEVNFSKDLDTLHAQPAGFRAVDSASNKNIPIVYTYFGKNSKILNIVLGAEAEKSRVIRLYANLDPKTALRDLNGNIIRDTLTMRNITMQSRNISVNPTKITSISLRDSSKNVDLAPVIDVNFSEPAEIEGIVAIFSDITANKALALDVQIVQSTLLRLKPSVKLESNHWFELQLRCNSIGSWNGTMMKDTAIALRFQSADMRLTGKVKGVLKDTLSGNYHVSGYNVSLVSEDGKRRYSQKIASAGVYEFQEIPEGKYSIEAYAIEDGPEDKTFKYYYGSAYPYIKSWRFARLLGLATVRSRWLSDIGEIELRVNR